MLLDDAEELVVDMVGEDELVEVEVPVVVTVSLALLLVDVGDVDGVPELSLVDELVSAVEDELLELEILVLEALLELNDELLAVELLELEEVVVCSGLRGSE